MIVFVKNRVRKLSQPRANQPLKTCIYHSSCSETNLDYLCNSRSVFLVIVRLVLCWRMALKVKQTGVRRATIASPPGRKQLRRDYLFIWCPANDLNHPNMFICKSHKFSHAKSSISEASALTVAPWPRPTNHRKTVYFQLFRRRTECINQWHQLREMIFHWKGDENWKICVYRITSVNVHRNKA